MYPQPFSHYVPPANSNFNYQLDLMRQYNDMHKTCMDYYKNMASNIRFNNHQCAVAALANRSMLPLEPYALPTQPYNRATDEFNYATLALCNGTAFTPASAALAMLSMVLSATLGRIQFRLTHEWEEHPTCYSIFIAPSGAQKSAICNRLKKPFEHFYEQYNSEALPPGSASLVMQVAKQQSKKSIKDAVNALLCSDSACDTSDAMAQLNKTLKQLHEIPKQFMERREPFAMSSTTQKLASRLKENKEHAAFLQPEGDLMNDLIDDKNLQELLLRGYTGEPWSRETTRTSITINRPCIQVTSFVQLDVASRFFSNKNLLANGLLARFIPCLCAGALIHSSPNVSLQPYNKKIEDVLAIYGPRTTLNTVQYVQADSDAVALVYQFREYIKQNYFQWAPRDSHPFLQKAHGLAARLALAYHIWCHDDPVQHKLDETSMYVGISLVQTVLRDVFFVYAETGLRAYPLAQRILENLRNISPCETQWIIVNGISSADIAKRVGKRLVDVNNALHYLASRNYLMVYDTGKSSHNVALHPCFFTPELAPLPLF